MPLCTMAILLPSIWTADSAALDPPGDIATCHFLGDCGSRYLGCHSRSRWAQRAQLAQLFLLHCLGTGVHCCVSDDCSFLVFCQSEHSRFWLADSTSSFAEGYADITVAGLCRADHCDGLPDEFHPLYVRSVGSSHYFHFTLAQKRQEAAA